MGQTMRCASFASTGNLPDDGNKNNQNRCRYFLAFSDKYCIFVPDVLKVRKMDTVQN